MVTQMAKSGKNHNCSARRDYIRQVREFTAFLGRCAPSRSPDPRPKREELGELPGPVDLRRNRDLKGLAVLYEARPQCCPINVLKARKETPAMSRVGEGN